MVKREIPQGPTSALVQSNLKEHREAAGLTYAELSRRLEEVGRNIPPLGLRRMEAGERRVDVDDLTALATVLEVSPMRLLLPLVSSAGIEGELTGTGPQPTDRLWLWALGYRSLDSNPLSAREFRRRSSPQTIYTYRERVRLRRQWLAGRIEEIDKRRAELEIEAKEENPFASGLRAQLLEEVEALENANPENDTEFAEQFGDEDPAPPSAEELAGLLKGADDA